MTQFIAVCSDELLLQFGGFELNRDVIVIGGDQSISSLKAGDIGNLRVCQFKGILDTHSFIIFQVQDDLRLGVIDDALPVFPTFQRKEVCQVLGRSNRRHIRG